MNTFWTIITTTILISLASLIPLVALEKPFFELIYQHSLSANIRTNGPSRYTGESHGNFQQTHHHVLLRDSYTRGTREVTHGSDKVHDAHIASINKKQYLCDSQDSDIFPSWCKYQNPFSTPFLFSDIEYPKETQKAFCDGRGPLSECINVVGIKVSEMVLKKEHDIIVRFVVFALKSGQMILTSFDYPTLTYFKQFQNETLHFFDVHPEVSGGQLASASEHTVNYYYGNVSDIYPFSLYHHVTFENRRIIGIGYVQHDGSIYQVTLLKPNHEAFHPPYKVFHHGVTLNSCIHTYFMNFTKVNKRERPEYAMTYTIEIDDGFHVQCPEPVPPLFQFFDHKENMTNKGITSVVSKNQRKMLLLSSQYHVKIIEFNPEYGSLEISITNDEKSLNYSTSSFYFVSKRLNSIITAATVVKEHIRRVDLRNSTCGNVRGNPSENIHLVIALQNQITKRATLRVHFIPEFGQYIYSNNERDPLNPVDRRQSFSCINGYWDDKLKECVIPRFHDSDIGEEKVLDIKERFIDLPEEFNGVKKYIDDILNLELLCEMIRDVQPVMYRSCLNFLGNTTVCDLDLLKNLDNDVVAFLLRRFFYSTIYISTNLKRVHIYGIQQLMNTEDQLLVQTFNQIPYIGNIHDMEVSPNGQHLFVTISRKLYELDSIQRYQEICEQLEIDPDNVFLKAFRYDCKSNPSRPIDLNQYAQYASSCFPGIYCPSLNDATVSQVEEGFYTLRPNNKLPCPAGYFCQNGIRVDCPIGYMCPEEKMTRPIPCMSDPKANSTCFGKNLLSPIESPAGTLAIAPYFPPIPANPGYFISPDRNIHECRLGDYCPLGRSASLEDLSELKCPPNTYCTLPNVTVPKICNCSEEGCSYCPAGTWKEIPCPAGYYCQRPDHREECSKTFYCPNGTLIPGLCPAGYYCSSPAQKEICPFGYYCVEGSVKPVRCALLALCYEGTTYEKTNFLGLVIDVLVIVGVIAIYYFYLKIQQYRRQRNERIRKGTLSSESQRLLSPLSDIAQGSKCRIDLRFENLGLVLKKGGKKVLDSVTGEIKSGELCAVMGLSGSGKSTFITALSGRASGYGKVTGNVFINGKEASLTSYNKLVGFVPQEDIMLRTMTVEEILYFSARTRLDCRKSNKDVQKVVDSVIRILNLEDVRHSLIGDENNRGISGGQRKRVNIGMELVSDPCILFLDEPTSGLDSSSSREVCSALQEIAKTGITVITVIHQPRYEIFTMFHNVLLLGKGGRTVYLGRSENALEYFEKIGFKCPSQVNPPDFFMDVINGDVKRVGDATFSPGDLISIWQNRSREFDGDWELINHSQKCKIESNESIPPDNDGINVTIESHDHNLQDFDSHSEPTLDQLNEELKNRRTSFILQFWMCFKRGIVQHYLRDLSGFLLDNVLVYTSGLFLGMIFYTQRYIGPPPPQVVNLCPAPIRFICTLPIDDPIISQSSLMPMTMGLTAVMASLPTFGSEEAVYQREASSGLSTMAYFLGKNMAQLPNILIAPLIFLSIFFTLSSAARGDVLEYYYILVLMHFAAYGLGYLISIVIRSSLSQLAGVVIVMICQLFSGARPTLPQLKDMFFPIPYIPYVSYIRYGQEALYLIEIKWYTDVYDVTNGMKLFDYSFNHFNWCVSMVAVFGVVFRFASYISLRCRLHNSYFQMAYNFVTDTDGHWGRIKYMFNKILMR